MHLLQAIRFFPFTFAYAPRRNRVWAYAALLTLGGILAYLLLGRAVRPDLTDYWGWLVGRAAATLAAVTLLNAAAAAEGGLSPLTHVLVIGATVAEMFGTAGHMYAKIASYDKLTHFATMAMIGAGIYEVLATLNRRGAAEWTPTRRMVWTVTLAMAIGIGWEIYEYVGDVVVHLGARTGGWPDTITDLIADALGAGAAAVVLWRRETRQHDGSAAPLPATATGGERG
jgi:uncharacterized membrane protein YjdF